MMLPTIKRQLLISASIALFVAVFDSQSVLSIDLDRRQSVLQADEKFEENTRDKTTRNLRAGSAVRSLQEKEEKEKEEDKEVPANRSAGTVVRPSYVFGPQEGREPTLAPSTSGGFARPGTSFFAAETPSPTQSSKQNQQSNPAVENGVYRPGGGSSFVYPTVAPSYSPIDYQYIPAISIPGINYIPRPRPAAGASWQDSAGTGGTQSYVAGKAPTFRPTPYPTTFSPVYVTAVNNPISRPGSTGMALPEQPSNSPTDYPSTRPSKFPTPLPTRRPTAYPTLRPTRIPTPKPTKKPSRRPTYTPTYFPTVMPSISPKPSSTPSRRPTIAPTDFPTGEPSAKPTIQPSAMPTSLVGTLVRPTYKLFTRSPTDNPTVENIETTAPSAAPTTVPTISTEPTLSAYPSSAPTSSTEPTLITSAPSIPPVFVSLFDNNAAEQQGGGGIVRPNFEDYPTWAPTTFLPTDTYSPTIWIDWSAGFNSFSGRFEPDATSSKVSNDASTEEEEEEEEDD